MIRVVPRIVASRLEPGVVPSFRYIAGEAIPIHAPVAKSEIDATKVLLASAATSLRMPVLGFALEAREAGQTVSIITAGPLVNVPRLEDFDPDDTVFISTTPGYLTKNPPEIVGSRVQRVGRAINASDVFATIDKTVIEIGPY